VIWEHNFPYLFWQLTSKPAVQTSISQCKNVHYYSLRYTGVISPTLQMEMDLLRIKKDKGRICEEIHVNVLPSLVECSYEQSKNLWFHVSWNIIVWCRKKFQILSMISYVNFEKGSSLNSCLMLELNFFCKSHLWVFFPIYENRQSFPCRIYLYILNIIRLKFISTVWRL